MLLGIADWPLKYTSMHTTIEKTIRSCIPASIDTLLNNRKLICLYIYDDELINSITYSSTSNIYTEQIVSTGKLPTHINQTQMALVATIQFVIAQGR